MIQRRRLLIPGAILGLALLGLEARGQEAPKPPKLEGLAARIGRTVAEDSGFTRTARSDEVAAFLDRASAAEHVRIERFGETVEGRPMLAAVIGRGGVASPESLDGDPRLVSLVIGNIHSGECAGKEALLRLIRELAADPKHPLLEGQVLIIAPNYNADGNERIGKEHRPGQVGPVEGMGQRPNAQDLDLNRDFVKLESPEARSLVGLMRRWDPQLFIDAHTTNGSWHQYALTYDVPHNPAAPQSLRDYLRKEMMPAVTAGLEKQGIKTFYYGNFDARQTRWSTYGHQPRYSTDYYGLRGRLAILSEAYAHLSFADRIAASHAFITACLAYAGEDKARVLALIRAADQARIAAGRAPKPDDEVSVAARIAPFKEPIKIPGYADAPKSRVARLVADAAAAVGQTIDLSEPRDYEVEFWGDYKSVARRRRPFAYVIPYDQSRVADRLLMHGVRLERLAAAAELEVEVDRIDRKTRARQSFQRHRLMSLATTPRRERRTLAEGAYLVRLDQPLAQLIMYLLEAESDDGLVTWNFFDHALRRGEDYPVLRIPAAAELETRPVTAVAPAQRLDLEQIYGAEGRVPFGGSDLASFQWLPGGGRYLKSRGERVRRVEAETGAEEAGFDQERMAETLAALPSIDAATARGLSRRRHRLSPDGLAVVFEHADDLFYYHFRERRALRLTRGPEPELYVDFSPDGAFVSFVRGHNLWLSDTRAGAERALTKDGTAEVLYGELDWVYQEEVYGRGRFKAYWWSPDSKRIAFLKLDERPVRAYTITDHIPVRGRLEVMRYPKAGDPNPEVALGVIPAAGGGITWVEHEQYEALDHLIVSVSWTPDGGRVIYQVQDRAQTWLDLRQADPRRGASKRLLRETSPAWVSQLGDPTWIGPDRFLWLSERSGHRHLYDISDGGQTARPITSGAWDMRGFHGIDAAQEWVYFSATKDSPIEVHGYRVPLTGGAVSRLTAEPGSHSLRFDESMSYFIDSVSAAHRPSKTHLHRADGTYLRTIEANPTDILDYYELTPPEFFEVPARDGHILQAKLIKPPNFDPSKKYPVMCYTYSGPQAPSVWRRWRGASYLWHQMLAQKGYLVWVCDNRSASSTGIKRAWPIHRDLGSNELRDLEDGLDWLKKKPWVDSERIGLWGWSYGGYMTSFALTHSKSFKMGIAGAPVTDWRNYDSIYTERYMGLPQDNPEGYRRSSVVKAAKDLHGKLLIIHGSIDDNVHMSNTLQLVEALQNSGKDFDLMIYPRNRHGVRRPAQMRHLRKLMTEYVLKNL